MKEIEEILHEQSHGFSIGQFNSAANAGREYAIQCLEFLIEKSVNPDCGAVVMTDIVEELRNKIKTDQNFCLDRTIIKRL